MFFWIETKNTVLKSIDYSICLYMWIEFWLVQSNKELNKYYKLLVFFWHFSKMKPTWFELWKILEKGNICHRKIVRKWWKRKTMKLSLITWRINICSSIAGKGWRLIKQLANDSILAFISTYYWIFATTWSSSVQD